LQSFAPKSQADMEAFRGRLKGAIVLLGEPAKELEPLMMVLPLRVDPKGAVPPPKETGPSLAARIGFLRSEGARAFLWDAGKPAGLLDMGDYEMDLAGDKGLPGAFVIHEQYLLLGHLAATGATARLSLEGRIGPAAECLNTVASIRGVAAPDEVVLVGAHLDSWDLGTGATDNAAGAGAVIEAARLLAASGARPRRSIRFVLFSGEEQGLFGSIAYVKKHKDELAHYSAVFIMDTGTGRVDGMSLQGRSEAEPLMRGVVEALVPLGVVDTDLRLEWGSDHLPFDEAGVPAFCFEQVQHDYSRHHHSEADTFDKVIPAELEQGAVVAALAAYRSAQLPVLLPRGRRP
jgi:Iap family predicted aminopeptidase